LHRPRRRGSVGCRVRGVRAARDRRVKKKDEKKISNDIILCARFFVVRGCSESRRSCPVGSWSLVGSPFGLKLGTVGIPTS